MPNSDVLMLSKILSENWSVKFESTGRGKEQNKKVPHNAVLNLSFQIYWKRILCHRFFSFEFSKIFKNSFLQFFDCSSIIYETVSSILKLGMLILSLVPLVILSRVFINISVTHITKLWGFKFLYLKKSLVSSKK